MDRWTSVNCYSSVHVSHRTECIYPTASKLYCLLWSLALLSASATLIQTGVSHGIMRVCLLTNQSNQISAVDTILTNPSQGWTASYKTLLSCSKISLRSVLYIVRALFYLMFFLVWNLQFYTLNSQGQHVSGFSVHRPVSFFLMWYVRSTSKEFGTNVHLGVGMNCSDFGGLKLLWSHFCRILLNMINQECLEEISLF